MASYHWARITVSIESAMRSRDWSEKLMPSVPMLMPSDTPMVLNRRPTRPDATTASRTCAASLSRCMLQGLPSHQLDTMPTCGLFISSSVSPVAYSMACEMPRVRGCVIRRLYLFVSWDGWSGMVEGKSCYRTGY